MWRYPRKRSARCRTLWWLLSRFHFHSHERCVDFSVVAISSFVFCQLPLPLICTCRFPKEEEKKDSTEKYFLRIFFVRIRRTWKSHKTREKNQQKKGEVFLFVSFQFVIFFSRKKTRTMEGKESERKDVGNPPIEEPMGSRRTNGRSEQHHHPHPQPSGRPTEMHLSAERSNPELAIFLSTIGRGRRNTSSPFVRPRGFPSKRGVEWIR